MINVKIHNSSMKRGENGRLIVFPWLKMKHGTTNFKMAAPFILAATKNGGSARFESKEFMDLVVERLYIKDADGNEIFSFTHYGEQNGDAMADPDMEVAVDLKQKRIIPRTWRNDYTGGRTDYVFSDGDTAYSKSCLTSLDEFFWIWMKNVHAQGFSPERIKE